LNEPDSGSVDDVVVAKEDLELEKVCGMMKRFTASILAEEEKPASSIETEEDFGLILTEFKRFRERNIELGDEERRRRAEQFALKFLDCFEE
jgi:hypothetical protein